MAVYSIAHDLNRGLAVALFSGTANTDQDYQEYIDSTLELDRPFQGVATPVFILVVDKGNPIPNAAWRQKIADATAVIQCYPVFVLVAASALVRGVSTAINWIRPPPYEFYVTADFSKAVDWVAKKRGEDMEQLTGLLQKARLLAEA